MLNQRTIFTLTPSFGRLARQAAVCAAVVALTACGGGDGGGGADMTIRPNNDQPGSIQTATDAPATPTDSSVPAQLNPNDRDVFRLEIREPGRLVITVTGAASTRVRVFDKDRNELPVVNGTVVITAEQTGNVFVEVSAAPNAGSTSTGSYTFRTNVITDMTASSTPPSI